MKITKYHLVYTNTPEFWILRNNLKFSISAHNKFTRLYLILFWSFLDFIFSFDFSCFSYFFWNFLTFLFFEFRKNTYLLLVQNRVSNMFNQNKSPTDIDITMLIKRSCQRKCRSTLNKRNQLHNRWLIRRNTSIKRDQPQRYQTC